eukprot:1180330-Rhodomonas_salina.4
MVVTRLRMLVTVPLTLTQRHCVLPHLHLEWTPLPPSPPSVIVSFSSSSSSVAVVALLLTGRLLLSPRRCQQLFKPLLSACRPHRELRNLRL